MLLSLYSGDIVDDHRTVVNG